MPPSAGPAIVATCQVDELSATARAELGARHEVGQQRLAGRHREGARNAEQHHHREHRPRRLEAVRSEREQQQRAGALEREARRQDAAPVAAVGEVTGRQDQQHERQELRQADQPQVERIARDRVDLPADGHGLHLHGQRGQEARGKEAGELAIGEQCAARIGRGVHAGARRVPANLGRGSITRFIRPPERPPCAAASPARACCPPYCSCWPRPRPSPPPRTPMRASRRSASAM